MKSNILAVVITTVLISCSIPVLSQDTHQINGYQGVSWKEVVPLKRVSFVGFDENSYLDDYSYLASIPVNAFYDDESGKIFSNPLLFYEPAYRDPVLNSNKGIMNFMDDWMTFCNGKLDQIQLINVKDENLEEKWDTSSCIEITADDPYNTASELALANWKKCDSAVVVSIAEEFNETQKKFEGSIKGVIPDSFKATNFEIRNYRKVGIIPQYNNFTISNQYKYVTANLTWKGGKAVDPDLQLINWDVGMVDASSRWSLLQTYDSCSSSVNQEGDWSASVTYMPTKSALLYSEDMKNSGQIKRDGWTGFLSSIKKLLPFDGKFLERLTTPKGVNYVIDVNLYPGIEIELPSTSYGCRNAIFNIVSNAKLGMFIKDKYGNNFPLIENNQATIDELGKGNYSIIVVKLDDTSGDIDVTLEYEWEQEFNELEGASLHSAAEGAILASLKNAPLFYATMTEVPSMTKKALDTLAVENIYYINLGENNDKDITESLKEYGTVEEYYDFIALSSKIHSMTKQNDIVFSTINPWSYWKAGTLQPEGEKRYAYYIGPAALAAAHHGTPLIITDMHPLLSAVNAWHNHEWTCIAPTRHAPHVNGMTTTGKLIYDFLDDIGLDGIGKESILTVAGQFDIGVTWDRIFPGAGNSGRIMGTPTDTAYWVCRSVFYPALIYANPALDPDGVRRITGSESERRGTRLNIITPEREVHVMYPILETNVAYEHRFNELTFDRWGVQYESAAGIIPYFEPSSNPIDEGSTLPYKDGQYYPDMSTSEVISFYAKKLGYDSIYTTNFPATIDNLNDGVIYWVETTHGLQTDTGSIAFWKDTQYESNPWRSYEQGGSTESPDTLTFMRHAGLDLLPSTIAGHDGIVIAAVGQLQTEEIYGSQMIDALENVHSACFLAGSCLISNTLLHLALVRSGFVYQVIDPWITSWYASFGFQMFIRELVFGATAGEAYSEFIRHVGIEYINEDVWWDTSENMEYFGDPDIVPYSPYNSCGKPQVFTSDKEIGGHSLNIVVDHPGKTPGFETVLIILVFALFCMIGMRKPR